MNLKDVLYHERAIIQLENILRTLEMYGEDEKKPFYEKHLKKHREKFQELLYENN